jgi:hypothetical protein
MGYLNMKVMIDGVIREATAEEVLKITSTLEQPTDTTPAPTKEELLAELQALTAKINALG